MAQVGNQGLDDRYIRLRSHRISYPVVLGLHQSHSIMFSRPVLDILKFSFHHSLTKFPFNSKSSEPELVSRPRLHMSDVPCLTKGNL